MEGVSVTRVAHGPINLGIRRDELVEVLTQSAGYAGLPAAVAALNAAAVSLEENILTPGWPVSMFWVSPVPRRGR